MKVMAQIFLCYARLDQRQVEELYNRLSNYGFKPWMDKKDILPGEKWELAIQKAIRSSDFFVACLSLNSVTRRGVIQKEIKEALDTWKEKLDSDIYLIPVRLEDCEVPESLRCFQRVDLFAEDGWARLVKALRVGMERRAEGIKPIVQEPIPFKPYPAHEKPSPGAEIATPEKGLEEKVWEMWGAEYARRSTLTEADGKRGMVVTEAETVREAARIEADATRIKAMAEAEALAIEARGKRETAIEEGRGEAIARADRLAQMVEALRRGGLTDEQSTAILIEISRAEGYADFYPMDTLAMQTSQQGGTQMPKVFISHSSKDDKFVQHLAGDLQEAGIEVWVDDRITVGDEFVEEINQGLFDSDYVAAVLSPNSIKSHWVKKEYSAGLNREVREGKKIVLPLLIGNILDRDIPPLLSDKNYADFRRDYKAGLGALFRALSFAPPSAVEAPQLVFEFELRGAWDEIQAMLEMIEQLAPECKGHVSALREAKAKLEACVVEDNECRFYETARWRKATKTIARFLSSKYSDPYVAEVAGKIGVKLASAFYDAGYRFYAKDRYEEAQALFEQAVELGHMHAEAVRMQETVVKILETRNKDLVAHLAEAKKAAYQGRYQEVIRIIEYIRSIDKGYRQSELDRLVTVAQLKRGGAS